MKVELQNSAHSNLNSFKSMRMCSVMYYSAFISGTVTDSLLQMGSRGGPLILGEVDP